MRKNVCGKLCLADLRFFSSASYGTTSFSPLPGAAELAEAKQLFQTKTNDNDLLAVELLRHKPACWQPEALYLLGRCVESGRGLPIRNAELASLARKPCWYLKKLAGLVWDEDDVLLGYRESFLARSRKAPQTSLLSKLTWRAAWLSRPVSTYAMQLSVEMQQFAARLKQERLLQPEDNAKDFRDVLGRWWLGRTDTHAAVRVTAMRAVLPSEDVLVEHTQVIELQRLRKKYKKLVPRTRYNKKQNLCKVWEQDCTKAMDEEQFQRLLLPRGSALDQTAGRGDASSTVRQQVRAWRPVQDRPVQERPAQSWVYLVGQVPLLLKQILRSFCRILGDEHVVVFRHAKDHDSARKKNAELQQSLLVVVDGCTRQAHEGQRKELLKVLRSDCKVPGNEGGGRTRPINLSPWRQVLVLPEANGESLWTSDQLRQKGLAVTLARLAAPASSSESLTDVPSSEELAQYLHACMLEDVALGGPPARQALADGYEQWLSAFRRDVATQEKLPGLDKPLETALPHVFRVKQGKNKGRFAIRPGDLVASFERFLDLGQGKLSERAEERFWARLQESFPELDLTKKLAHNIYASSGKGGKGAKGLLLFPYTTDVLYPERDNAVEKPGARPARAAQLVFPNPNIPTDSRFVFWVLQLRALLLIFSLAAVAPCHRMLQLRALL
eukprot:g65225.t1